MDLKKLLRRKSSSVEVKKTEEETPYVQSPSALQYPGVKAEPKAEAAPKPTAAEGAKSGSGLPRCPKCGWSIGYTDRECSNCGQVLLQRR